MCVVCVSVVCVSVVCVSVVCVCVCVYVCGCHPYIESKRTRLDLSTFIQCSLPLLSSCTCVSCTLFYIVSLYTVKSKVGLGWIT